MATTTLPVNKLSELLQDPLFKGTIQSALNALDTGRDGTTPDPKFNTKWNNHLTVGEAEAFLNDPKNNVTQKLKDDFYDKINAATKTAAGEKFLDASNFDLRKPETFSKKANGADRSLGIGFASYTPNLGNDARGTVLNDAQINEIITVAVNVAAKLKDDDKTASVEELVATGIFTQQQAENVMLAVEAKYPPAQESEPIIMASAASVQDHASTSPAAGNAATSSSISSEPAPQASTGAAATEPVTTPAPASTVAVPLTGNVTPAPTAPAAPLTPTDPAAMMMLMMQQQAKQTQEAAAAQAKAAEAQVKALATQNLLVQQQRDEEAKAKKEEKLKEEKKSAFGLDAGMVKMIVGLLVSFLIKDPEDRKKALAKVDDIIAKDGNEYKVSVDEMGDLFSLGSSAIAGSNKPKSPTQLAAVNTGAPKTRE